MMWNTMSPVSIIFIGFSSIRHSGACQGRPSRITFKVVLHQERFFPSVLRLIRHSSLVLTC